MTSPPETTPEPRMYTEDDMVRATAREKAQGHRAGAAVALKEALSELGFEKLEDAKAAITAKRDADRERMSEADRKLAEATERERRAEERERAAAAREARAGRRVILAGLGAVGVDLDDAEALLKVADDADEEAIKQAAEALKARRPELFSTVGGGPTPVPTPNGPQPAGLGPAPGGPPRPGAGGAKPWGAAGLEEARRRGYIRDGASAGT